MNGRRAREQRRRDEPAEVNEGLRLVGHQAPIADLEAEASVLGALLLDPDAIGRVVDLVAAEDFHRESNGAILLAARNQLSRREPIDNVTLAAELTRMGMLERVGGRSHLAELQERVPTAANVEHYAARVRMLGARRAFRDAVTRLAQRTADPTVDVAELAAGAREAAGLAERGTGVLKLPVHSPAELVASAPEEPAWIARGFVALGAVTELSASIKAGKTTWIMALIAASLDRHTFLGQRTQSAFWLYVSEEGPVTLVEALRRAGLAQVGPDDLLVVLRREVRGLGWPELVAAGVAEAERRAGGRPVVVVIDTLASVAGLAAEAEKDAGAAQAAMGPLTRAATEHGFGVVVGRHDRKAGGEVGESGRGSSAFGGEADILLQLRRVRRDDDESEEEAAASNVRLLAARSRFTATPGQDETLRIRLDAGGYTVLGTLGETQAAKAERRYQAILDVVSARPGASVRDVRASVKAKAADTSADIKALLEEGALVLGPVARQRQDGRTYTAEGLFVPGGVPVPRAGNRKEPQGTTIATGEGGSGSPVPPVRGPGTGTTSVAHGVSQNGNRNHHVAEGVCDHSLTATEGGVTRCLRCPASWPRPVLVSTEVEG